MLKWLTKLSLPFTPPTRERCLALGEFERGQIKVTFEWDLPSYHQTDQIVALLWEWDPFFCLQYWQHKLLFSNLPLIWGIGDGLEQIKTPQSLLFLLIISHFSWLNAPHVAASLWLISRVLKNLILTIFSSFIFVDFMEGQTFRGP